MFSYKIISVCYFSFVFVSKIKAENEKLFRSEKGMTFLTQNSNNTLKTVDERTCLAECLYTTYCEAVNIEMEQNNEYKCDLFDDTLLQRKCPFDQDIPNLVKKHSNVKFFYTKREDCKSLRNQVQTKSAWYTVFMNGKKEIYCDMEKDGGGWTQAFNIKGNPQQSSAKTWAEFKQGFATGEVYWLGNEVLHQMTKCDSEAKLIIEDSTESREIYYEHFKILSEDENYKLEIQMFYKYDADRSNGLLPSRGMPFTTFDKFNTANCYAHSIGWWDDESCTARIRFLNGGTKKFTLLIRRRNRTEERLLSQEKQSTQSSVRNSDSAEKGNDGIIDNNQYSFTDTFCMHTDDAISFQSAESWWEVDLQDVAKINRLYVYNRRYEVANGVNWRHRFHSVKVEARYKEVINICAEDVDGNSELEIEIMCVKNTFGSVVKLIQTESVMNLCEIQVYGYYL